jgi:hypothetical protein
MQSKVSYYIYSKIPGAGKGWSLAVCAVNRRDADEYIHKHHRGGKFSYDVTNGGTVKADCGAITPAAHDVIKSNLGKMWSEI